jgi:hypothetical protein
MENNIKELFLEPIAKSETKHESPDEFLKAQGIDISKSSDGHPVVSIRFGKNTTFYGFKKVNDLVKTAVFLSKHNVHFECDDTSRGARYEYHIAVIK